MSQHPSLSPAPQATPARLAAGRHTTMVVGYLDQDTSAAALLAAAELAHRLQATLHIVQALDDLVPDSAAAVAFVALPDGALTQDQIRSVGEAGRRQVEQLLEGSPVSWTWTTAVGKPAEVLQEHADRVDAYAVVVGLRERSLGSFVEHLLVGSTITRMREQTTRPLLLVPSAPAAPAAATRP